MNRRWWILMAAAALLVIVAVASAVTVTVSNNGAGASNTSNDHVNKGQDFQEYFKDDGDGKNYLYTATQVDAPPVGKCIIVTGDSERTVSVSCNYGGK